MPKLNQVGVPPPIRTIHRRRAQLEAESAAHEEGHSDSRQQLVLGTVTFVVLIAVAALVAWLVL